MKKICLNTFRLLFIFLVLSPDVNGNQQQPVARVGKYIILENEFRDYLLYNVAHVKLFSTHEQRLKHLSNLIDKKLMLIDAYQHNLDKDSELLERLKYVEQKAVLQFVKEKEIIEKAIPDHLVKSLYDKMGKQVKLCHIYLPFNNDKSDSTVIFNYIKQLRSRIIGGEDFGGIAKEFSKDTTTAINGGSLGYVRWGHRGLGDDFYEIAYGLKIGEISEPIRTSSGYHIIKVDGKRTVEKPPFDDLKYELRERFFSEKNAELEQYERDLIARVRQHFNTYYNYDTLEFLISFVEKLRQSQKHSLKERIGLLLPKVLSESELTKVLIHFEDKEYTIKKFLAGEGKTIRLNSIYLNAIEELEEFLNPLISDDELLIKWGYERQYHHQKKLKDILAKTKESMMVRLIERMTIDEQFVKPDVLEVENYYLEHKEKYFFPEKRKVQEIFVRNRDLAQQIYHRAIGNESFDELTARYNERKLTKRTNGVIGFISADQHGEVGKEAATMEVGEISEPFKIRDGYSIIKILEKKPERQKTFIQAKRDAENDLTKFIIDSTRRAWLDYLKTDVKIQIYEDNLRDAFAD